MEKTFFRTWLAIVAGWWLCELSLLNQVWNLSSKTFFVDEWFWSSINATYHSGPLYMANAHMYVVFYEIAFDRQIFLIGKNVSLKIGGAI
jgi:hypothetical protein